MRPVVKFVKTLVMAPFGLMEVIMKKVVEGSRTEAAKGRTQRLREARTHKERQSRTGNKSTD